MKLLLYCTKAKQLLAKVWKHQYELMSFKEIVEQDALNGKIVAECDFEVEEIKYQDIENYNYDEILPLDKILEKSCLTKIDLEDYLNGNNGYAIHIKNLHIFDEPRPTKWYGYTDKKGYLRFVEKAPQNMMHCYDAFDNDYVLISIQPQWLCKILNGDKTIEVRKKVLKRMLDNEK